MVHPRVVRRALWASLTGTLAIAGALCGLFYYQTYRANAAIQSLTLPTRPPSSHASRVVVVAAHCDDETLGVGGTMAQAARAGARVRVVLLTNGDGFQLAASKQYLRLVPSPRTYMDLAGVRQGETRQALQALGVPREAVVFLGYPDGGLAALWDANWSVLYTSPFTRRSRSPYRDSPTPGAPYTGQSVLADLSRLLEAEQPTDLYVPDPADDHPDHWASYCFTMAALESLRDGADRIAARPAGRGPRGSWARRTQVHTYLIHHGDWPVPQGLRETARLVPPASLLHLDTAWERVPLSPEDVDRKRSAVLSYGSQTAVMRRFLTSFIRRDELFGIRPADVVHGTAGLPATLSPADEHWSADSTRMIDASRDTLLRRIDPAADLQGLDAVLGSDRLLLRVSARGALSRRVEYRLDLHPVGLEAGAAGKPLVLRLDEGSREGPGVTSQWDRNNWVVGVSLAQLGLPGRVIVGVESRVGNVVLDRLSARVLRLSPPADLPSPRPPAP